MMAAKKQLARRLPRPGFGAWRRFAAALLICLWGSAACAQERGDERPAAAEKSPPPAAPLKTNDGEKRAANGVLIPLPEFEKFQEWQRRSRSPDYSVSSIDLKGAADDERATLTATITIQVNRDDEDFRIPLHLKEATLTDHSYQGNGTATPDEDFSANTGYHWWFRGKGEHVLRLSMIVPVKKQLPKRRLQLTVPPTAVSRLQLHVPAARLNAAVDPEDAWLKATPDEKSGTAIDVQGFRRRLDLSWEPLPLESPLETVLQSRTLIDVRLTGESVVLEAQQQIRAVQGSFDSVTVRLPAGYKPRGVEGKTYRDHQVSEANFATVTLTEATDGLVELKWTLEADFPETGGKLTLEGFEVDRAQRQSGQIAIGSLSGFRITRRDDDSRDVRKIDVKELDNTDEAASAYGFLRQPFRLVLDLHEIEPGFTMKPRLRLHVTPTRARLDARFSFDVYRGAVDEVLLQWPGADRQGWTIESIGPPDLLNRDQADERPDEGLIAVPLLRRMQGKFDVHLRASRPLSVGEEFPLSLPTVEASSRQPALLDVFSASNVEVQFLVPDNPEDPLPIQPAETGEPLPPELRPLSRTTYRVESPERELVSEVIVRERKVATDALIDVGIDGKRLLVKQRLGYRVEYEPLAQVLLLIPEELVGRVRFSLDGDLELTPNSTMLDEGPLREVRLMLPKTQIGEFEIAAQFEIELASLPSPGTPKKVVLPLLQSSDSPLNSARLKWSRQGQIDAAPLDRQVWELDRGSEKSADWMANDVPEQVSLRLTDSARRIAQELHVGKALIRTVVDSSGTTRSQAQYQIDGAATAVTMTFPPDEIVLDRVWWGSQELGPDEKIVVDLKRRTFRFKVASAPQTGPHLLKVVFHSAAPSPLEWSSWQKLSAPRLDSDVWIDETIWQVSLPGSQLLFTQPGDFTPRFRWQRQGFIWSRLPAPSDRGLDEWIDAADTPDDGLDAFQGNSYRFSRLGPASQIGIRTMSLPFVVFLGAGLSLAGGFLLLYLPLTRNVLTFLFVAFAVSAIALWFPASVQLLLQPAVLGLVLAVVAATIDSTLRRDRRLPVLTLTSPSELNVGIPSPSSVESPAPAAARAGSEDPTALRPAAAPSRDLIAAPESGSHV